MPLFFKPLIKQLCIARLEKKLSVPPLRITAFPDFKHNAPASAVTFGRLSYITPITPNGVEIREMLRPLGLDQLSKFLPIGSSKDAISLKAIAIPLIRSSSNLSLSMNDSDRPLLIALSISF